MKIRIIKCKVLYNILWSKGCQFYLLIISLILYANAFESFIVEHPVWFKLACIPNFRCLGYVEVFVSEHSVNNNGLCSSSSANARPGWSDLQCLTFVDWS